jgi:hypothetical protein
MQKIKYIICLAITFLMVNRSFAQNKNWEVNLKEKLL